MKTKVVGIRISIEDVNKLEAEAVNRGMGISDYIKGKLGLLVQDVSDSQAVNNLISPDQLQRDNIKKRSVGTTVNEAILPVNTEIKDLPKEEKLAMLRGLIESVGKKPYDPETMNRTMDLPIYDPTIHKVGDKVRVRLGKRWIAKTVPAIDADGNII